MPVWNVPKVEEQPTVHMHGWGIVRVKYREGDDGTEDRLVGSADGAGRISSAITEFDKENMVATTRSGRKYKLSDHKSLGGGAGYILAQLKRVVFETELVTEEYTKGTVK